MHTGKLRASAKHTGDEVDLRAAIDPSRPAGVPAAAELLAFAEALVSGAGLDEARERLVAAVGRDGARRAATVAANFHMTNRVLDATGCPVPKGLRPLAKQLGLDERLLP